MNMKCKDANTYEEEDTCHMRRRIHEHEVQGRQHVYVRVYVFMHTHTHTRRQTHTHIHTHYIVGRMGAVSARVKGGGCRLLWRGDTH
jgi:hypothetical protein